MSDSISTSADALGASIACRPVLMGTRHMAVAGHYAAAHAAFVVLEAGGNAVLFRLCRFWVCSNVQPCPKCRVEGALGHIKKAPDSVESPALQAEACILHFRCAPRRALCAVARNKDALSDAVASQTGNHQDPRGP